MTPSREAPAGRGSTTPLTRGASLVLLAWLALGATAASAQEAPVTRDSITLVPGPQFSTTSWIRWLGTALFGARNRVIWNIPITLPILDLAATGGGLRAAGEGTGRAVGSVYLDGADGSHWAFVPLDRTAPRTFPSGIVPASVTAGIIADLTSGRNPAGPLVAAALAEAASVPNQAAWLVSLPPRTALGTLQAGDSGRAGYLVRRDPVPTSDSTGPVAPGSVVTSLDMVHRTRREPAERVDARAVLRASLFNVYVGSLNPLFLEWRWEAAPSPEGGLTWRPLGTFREGALARYDGIATYLSRPLQPDLTTFGPDYPRTLTGIPHQASVYRYLIGSPGRPVWDSVAAELQASLTDSVIAAAVGKMPAPYQALVGDRLLEILRERRDHLPRAVELMFKQVRNKAEVYGSATAEAVLVEWPMPDSLTLRVGNTAERFAGGETGRVTLFLGGGQDTLRIAGGHGQAPALRVVPAAGAPLVVEGAAGKRPVGVYGMDLDVTADPPGAIPLRSKDVGDPLAHLDSTGAERTEGRRNFSPTGWLELTSGVGLLIGGGVVRTDWSGEARPFRNRLTLRAAYGTDANRGVIQLLGDFRWAHSPLQLRVDAVASAVGAVYFYGFGNDTPGDSASSYYRAGRELYAFAPSLVLPLSKRVKVGAGVELKSVTTPVPDTLFIGVDQPYGTPTFGEAGFTGQFTFDTRDVRGAPRHGILATLEGAWYPWIRDGSGAFGTLSGSIATYLTPPWWSRTTVAARVSGTHTAGDVPYFEAAFVGGGRTVRGLPMGRYEGNSAVFANLDLRVRLSRVTFVLPWDFGVLGLADVGRVFVDGEQSDTWHPSFGGGVWAALLDRSLAASLNVATGAGEGTFVNAGAGFTF